MSLASCSMRFVSSPAFLSDCGLQVESARSTISSPDATWSTGCPAASYQPQATVVGVGKMVCVRPEAGAGHETAAPFAGRGGGAFDVETEDGGWHPSADTPPRIASAEVIRIIRRYLLLRDPRWDATHSTCFATFGRCCRACVRHAGDARQTP